ncbi:class I SAM-dependent methyltransferase [Mycobacterium montefiorense]|uniref:class I SAM-dependent methyltransferase n=1 Tax=Mycobacterium montefiorense TaxID=154654 RepID=UPI0021DE1A11|nr:class I SAM-dependent methyltransferase [Mycobacterium montefiorense]MCV7429319.1 class I SAM-dependent methyltransferase [Mycobacterium montefiorense]GLE53305.1 putative S-adenosyl-L-methionine-dependent methyltransferase [Mycobacterium montefiorense]
MRTDRDTWDITTGVGSTALFVAAARALEARKLAPLAVDQYAELFCRAAGGDWLELLDGAAPHHKLCTDDFGQHFVNYQGARTKYFDRFCASAIAAGIRQVVILAAGLDSRAYRLQWNPDTVLFELDQPLVHAFKRRVLTTTGAVARTTRREVAVDLRDNWGKSLHDNGFDPTQPTAWLVEGLSMYLGGDTQGQLFDAIATLSSPGSMVALEQMAVQPDVVLDRLSDDAAERGDAGELRFLSLICNQRRDEAATWFRCHGWQVERIELLDLLNASDRATPEIGGHAWFMFSALSLVTAVRAG